jgi:hypothetical protein
MFIHNYHCAKGIYNRLDSNFKRSLTTSNNWTDDWFLDVYPQTSGWFQTTLHLFVFISLEPQLKKLPKFRSILILLVMGRSWRRKYVHFRSWYTIASVKINIRKCATLCYGVKYKHYEWKFIISQLWQYLRTTCRISENFPCASTQ